MKRTCVALISIMLIAALCDGISLAESSKMETYMAVALTDEPLPCGLKFFQEEHPFDLVPVNPMAFMETISSAKSVEEVDAVLQSLDITFFADDSFVIYRCKDIPIYTDYRSIEIDGRRSQVATLEYRDSLINIVFVFLNDGETWMLADRLDNFWNIQAARYDGQKILWLIGDIGSEEYQTVRWYNVNNRRIDIVYLRHGTMADRTDYHVVVNAYAEAIYNETIPSDGMVSVYKHVGIIDLTDERTTSNAPGTYLYTQVDIYAIQSDMSLQKIKTDRYDWEDQPSISWYPVVHDIDETDSPISRDSLLDLPNGLYYNDNGGKYYHADARCPTVDPKYFPLIEIAKNQLHNSPYYHLKPCSKCVHFPY